MSSLKAQEARNQYVVKSNALIQQSRFSLSLQAQRCLLYAISLIKPSDPPETEYEFSIRDLCEACGIDLDTAGEYYRAVKRELKELRDRSIWITLNDGRETTFAWFQKVTLNRGSSTVSVKFDETASDYLFMLQSRYTQYRLSNVLCMKSKYSIRLWELLISYVKKREIENGREEEVSFTLDDLKERLDASTYSKFSDFQRFALSRAVDEINLLSEDIHVEYELQKKGRTVEKVIFVVTAPHARQLMAARKEKQRRYGMESREGAQK